MIVKLHTVDSTNSYLKNWIQKNSVKNYTIIHAEKQTSGRGQRGNKWISEPYKNLLFSMFVEFNDFQINNQFQLNQAISLGITDALRPLISYVQIKWPNDIMAGNYKIAGILIENSIRGNNIKHSIIGVGINVNQRIFPSTLAQANSLSNLLNKDINRETLLINIQEALIKRIQQLINDPFIFEKEYLQNLYLFNKEAYFTLIKNKKQIKGRISGVTHEGLLIIKSEGKDYRFNFKEVVFDLLSI